MFGQFHVASIRKLCHCHCLYVFQLSCVCWLFFPGTCAFAHLLTRCDAGASGMFENHSPVRAFGSQSQYSVRVRKKQTQTQIHPSSRRCATVRISVRITFKFNSKFRLKDSSCLMVLTKPESIAHQPSDLAS